MLADWPNYATTNPVVEDQIADSDSIYNTYKDLIAFRTENPIISLGTMSQVADFKGKGSIIKFEYDAEVVYVAFNYSEGQVELTNLTDGVDLEILYNVNGAETDGSSLTLAGRGVAVFTTAGEISESSGKQTGTITVYFSAPASDWGNTAYCYLWNDDSKQSNANWPGIEMTFVKVNEYNQRIYTIDVDLDKYDMIIFNNNKGWQSKDTSLASAEDGMGFYLNGDNSLGTYTFS